MALQYFGDVVGALFTVSRRLERSVWRLHEEVSDLTAMYHMFGSFVCTAEALDISIFVVELSVLPRKVAMWRPQRLKPEASL